MVCMCVRIYAILGVSNKSKKYILIKQKEIAIQSNRKINFFLEKLTVVLIKRNEQASWTQSLYLTYRDTYTMLTSSYHLRGLAQIIDFFSAARSILGGRV